jgi:hypothetical protein
MSEETSHPRERCSYCGAPLVVVHVHGHGQCQACGTNVDPCCAGANPGSEAMQPGANAVPVDAAMLRRVFEELGGSSVTVTEQCFLFALSRALDAPLDEARAVLEAGVDLGLLHRAASTVRLALR